MLLRTVRCVNGEVQVLLDCEPVFDYGQRAAHLGVLRRRLPRGHAPTAEGCDVELRLTTDMRVGFEGPRATARTLMKEGDTLFAALSWSEHPAPTTSTRPTTGSSGPPTTGSTGSTTASSPTTPGAPTCSAAR